MTGRRHRAGCIRKWVERNDKSPLGTTPMKRVTRALLEDFVAFLDEQVEEEIIAPKTAGNIWGELSARVRTWVLMRFGIGT